MRYGYHTALFLKIRSIRQAWNGAMGALRLPASCSCFGPSALFMTAYCRVEILDDVIYIVLTGVSMAAHPFCFHEVFLCLISLFRFCFIAYKKKELKKKTNSAKCFSRAHARTHRRRFLSNTLVLLFRNIFIYFFLFI